MSCRRLLIVVLPLALLATVSTADAQDFTGRYVIESPEGTFALDLRQDGAGAVQGQLTGAGLQLVFMGARDGSGISGRAQAATGEIYGFVAQLQGQMLQLQMFPFDYAGNPAYAYAETLVFTRSTSGPAGEAPGSAPAPSSPGRRSVTINRVMLKDAQLQRIESQYGTRIPNGSYWYDSKCGAWGLEGGPTQGFILANLELPGPMPADISGGGTGIYFNGREIHIQDQLALQQVFGVTIPGRYWLDAMGNLGIEGNPTPIANLAAAVRASQGGQYGSATGMGGTAALDGQGGAMFSGRTPDGKSVFWYSGQ